MNFLRLSYHDDLNYRYNLNKTREVRNGRKFLLEKKNADLLTIYQRISDNTCEVKYVVIP